MISKEKELKDNRTLLLSILVFILAVLSTGFLRIICEVVGLIFLIKSTFFEE